MKREELVQGEWYATKEYDTITCVQILDLNPWKYDERRNLVPAKDGVTYGQNILIFTENGELDLMSEDEITVTWDEFTALERWLKAERKWKADQISNKMVSTGHVLKSVLEVSGIKVESVKWNDSFAELSFRINIKETK